MKLLLAFIYSNYNKIDYKDFDIDLLLAADKYNLPGKSLNLKVFKKFHLIIIKSYYFLIFRKIDLKKFQNQGQFLIIVH
jgi:hypothetical protein